MKKNVFYICLLALSLGLSSLANAQGNGKSSTNQGATPNGKPFAHLSEQLQVNAAAIAALGTEIQEVRNDVGSINVDLGELEDLITLNQVAISQLQADLASTNQDVADLLDLVNTNIDDINTEIDFINGQIANLQDALGSLADALAVELAALQAEVDTNSGDISSLLVNVNLLTSQIVLVDLVLDDHEDRITTLEDGLGELELLVASLDARLVAVEQGEGTGTEGLCFSFENTVDEDLTGNDWFDTCVAAAQNGGTSVRIVLKDVDGNTVYDASGNIVGNWTQENITTTSTRSNNPYNYQYWSYEHDQLVTLDNGDKLMIAGKNGYQFGCGGSFGNGYGIVVYPSNPDYIYNPKMIVMPYRHQLGNNQPRYFSGWSQATEISWNGSSFNSCGNVPGFEGTFEFYVY